MTLLTSKIKLKLGNYWKDVLDAAVTYHDVSHGSTGSGEIPYGPHAVASSLIAYMITKNKDVADLVYSHNEDKIPNNHDEKSAAEMIIRDADQLALMGHSGLIRSAYYWGFRHKLMDDEPHKIVSEMKLCDPRCDGGGLPYDHEKNTRLFCLETVFPFLIESRQVDRAKAHSQTNIERFFGSQKLEQNFLAALRYGNSDLEKALKGEFRLSHWNLSFKAEEIQRIDERYSHLFIRKPLIDFSILQTCEAIEFFLSHFEEEEAKIEIRKLLDGGDETIPWE